MSFEGANRGVHVSAGNGIVAHFNGLTAFAAGDDDEQLTMLVVRLNALSGQPWIEVVRSLTAEIVALKFDAHPSIAAVSIEPNRVAAFVFGAAKLSLTIDGSETTLDGRDSSTWIDVALHGQVEQVLAGTQSSSPLVGILRDGVIPASGFKLDTKGPMPAPGRWTEEVEPNTDALAPALDQQSAFPVATVEPLEAAEPAPPAPIEAAEPGPVAAAAAGLFSRIEERIPDIKETPIETDPIEETPIEDNLVEAAPIEDNLVESALDQDDDLASLADVDEFATDANTSVFQDPGLIDSSEPPEALAAQSTVETAQPAEPSPIAALTQIRPQVRGVRCDSGHLTAPGNTPCITCGALVDTYSEEEIGDRPVLGRLTFDDGAVMNIDRPAAIGTDVPAGYEIHDELATIVRLDDGMGGIADVQIEVRLSGWQVDVVDVSPMGGTYTLLGGERQTRTKLRTGQSITLQPGMRIEVGRRSFTFDVGPKPPSDLD